MNELIEAGDPRTKVVGKRRAIAPGEESLKVGLGITKTALAIRKTPLEAPRGVFRFKTHEEADQWWTEILTR